jgi:hypothetical protein
MDPHDETEPESAFSDKDKEDIVASLTEEDLRERSQALHEAQETYEELAYLTNPKMPCPECGGAGSVHGGSLGDVCVNCGGARVVEAPGGRKVEMPPFAALRWAISTYGNALADHALPVGHRAKKYLELPAPTTVPTLEKIQKLQAEGLAQARQLTGQPGIVDPKLLKEAKPAKGLSGEGDLGEYEDAELDDMEPPT